MLVYVQAVDTLTRWRAMIVCAVVAVIVTVPRVRQAAAWLRPVGRTMRP